MSEARSSEARNCHTERDRLSWTSRCRSGTGADSHAPLRSAAVPSADTGLEAATGPGLDAAMHCPAELAPICVPAVTNPRERQLGLDGEKEEEENSPLLHRNAPLTDGADPEMFLTHGDEGHKAQLEPHARFNADGRHCCHESQPAVGSLSDGSGG